jgi:hypothetical protein
VAGQVIRHVGRVVVRSSPLHEYVIQAGREPLAEAPWPEAQRAATVCRPSCVAHKKRQMCMHSDLRESQGTDHGSTSGRRFFHAGLLRQLDRARRAVERPGGAGFRSKDGGLDGVSWRPCASSTSLGILALLDTLLYNEHVTLRYGSPLDYPVWGMTVMFAVSVGMLYVFIESGVDGSDLDKSHTAANATLAVFSKLLLFTGGGVSRGLSDQEEERVREGSP